MAKSQRTKIITKKHLARLERERRQTRYTIIAAIVIIVSVVGIVTFGILDQTVLKDLQTVAQVDNTRINAKDFSLRVRYTRYQMLQQYNSTLQMAQYFGNVSYFQSTLDQLQSQMSDKNTIGDQVLTQMIEDILIRREAPKFGLTASKDEVDKAMQEAFGYFPNGTLTPSITPTTVLTPTLGPTSLALVTLTPTPTEAPTATLAPETPTPSPTVGTPAPTSTPFPTSTPITLQGYQGLVKKYITNAQLDITNMSESALRNIMENTLYRQKMLAAVTKDLKPEVQQVWARHILVADEATAKDIVNQLNNGGDFAKLAAQYSTDTSNKDTGGDLGWFSSGQMVAEFEKAAFALKVGEISAPVQTQYGWHVIQSLGNEVRPLDASQFDTLKQTTFQDYLNKLISDDKNIKKLDVWMQVVPGDPTLPPLPTAAPSGQ